MKKRYLIVAITLALLVNLLAYREEIAKAGGGVFGLTLHEGNPGNSQGAPMSTSTLNYLSIGAGTTTVTINTASTDQVDVNVFAVASSTLTDLRWRVEFSHSTTTVVGNQLWFPEPAGLNQLATTTVTTRTSKEYSWVFASSTPHRIATSTAANGQFDQDTTGSFTFRIKDIAAQWTRVIFYVPTGASTANDNRMDTLSESTALGIIPSATSTNIGIFVQPVLKQPF